MATSAAEIVEFPRKTALGCQAFVLPSNLGRYIADSLHSIANHMKLRGIPVTGGHYTRYLVLSPVLMCVQVCIEIDEQATKELGQLPGPLQVLELPACQAAHVTHVGPYEQLPSTYMALCSWIRQQGLYPGHISLEQYLTNPETQPDSSKYHTAVFWSVSESFFKSRGWS